MKHQPSIQKSKKKREAKLAMMKFCDRSSRFHFSENLEQTNSVLRLLNGARLFCVCASEEEKSDFDNFLHVRHSTRFLNESLNKNSL